MKFKLVEVTENKLDDTRNTIYEKNEKVRVDITCKHKVLTPEFTKDGILICPDSWEDGWRD